MNKVIIKVDGLSKAYKIGEFSTGTMSRDIERWISKKRGREDRLSQIGEKISYSNSVQNDAAWSLRDVSFEIHQGDSVGIIGRNGAGKSTLLKILSRITTPSLGRVRIKGRIASLLEVGTGFHPELTGRENIFLNGAILGMRKSEIRKHFDAIVNFSGVGNYIDTPVKRYSSGMYVRLAFAVTAHLESEILVIDEILAVGDSEFQKKCLGKMDEISSKEGRTVLFVSHNMASIKSLCKTSLLLKNGRLTYAGLTETAIEKYVNQDAKTTRSTIRERVDRSGNKQVQVTQITVNDKFWEPEIMSTDDLIFNIEYASTLKNYSAKILVGVYDAIGTPIFFLDSESIKDLSNNLTGSGEINIKIANNFAMHRGKYTINLAFFVNGEMADYIQNAITFIIIDDDFLGSGKIPSGHYTIIPKQTWIIK